MNLVKVGSHWIDPSEVAAICSLDGRAVVVILRGSGAKLELFPADADAVHEALSQVPTPRGESTPEEPL